MLSDELVDPVESPVVADLVRFWLFDPLFESLRIWLRASLT